MLVTFIFRSSGQKGCRGWSCCQALHQDQSGSWKWHGHSLPQCKWSPTLPQPTWVRTHTLCHYTHVETWDLKLLNYKQVNPRFSSCVVIIMGFVWELFFSTFSDTVTTPVSIDLIFLYIMCQKLGLWAKNRLSLYQSDHKCAIIVAVKSLCLQV